MHSHPLHPTSGLLTCPIPPKLIIFQHSTVPPPCQVPYCPNPSDAAGDFITSVSGRAFEAASKLVTLSASDPSSSDIILVSDSIRQLLDSSHVFLQFGGGHQLIRASQCELDQHESARGSKMSHHQRLKTAKQLAAAARRQMIRRKYEALEVLLARGEGLQPAPEHLLTQPPPVRDYGVYLCW